MMVRLESIVDWWGNNLGMSSSMQATSVNMLGTLHFHGCNKERWRKEMFRRAMLPQQKEIGERKVTLESKRWVNLDCIQDLGTSLQRP